MRRTPDAIFAGLAVAHGVAIAVLPVAPVIAIGVWWNSNTIAHNFIHRPFFRARAANRLFAVYQSLVTGVPQSLWRERHLAHHAGVPWRFRLSRSFVTESMLIVALWAALAWLAPAFFAYAYVPGYLTGLLLCAMQGHYEHARGTTSHYGRLYNLLCVNDGYHVEHHAYPGVHWSELPGRVTPGAPSSRWPALLRWLDVCSLDGLERLALHSPRLQTFVLKQHRRAFRPLLSSLGPIRRILVVGGGLFPRSALILRELLPDAELVVVDASTANLESGRRVFDERQGGGAANVRFEHRRFTGDEVPDDVDLVVVPLAYDGNRQRIYERPPARAVIVHDWCWRRRGEGRLVSLLLLKCVNLVRA